MAMNGVAEPLDELDKFISKFISLWQSGSNVRLNLNADGGKANISMHVKLNLQSFKNVKKSGRDSPCRQKRRLRRAAEREARAVTKNTTETVQVEDQEEYVKDQAEMSVTEFNVKINAHEGVKGYDNIEATEENFIGGLKDMNVNEEDPCYRIKVHEVDHETFEHENGQKMMRYRFKLFVKNTEKALAVIEDWKTPSNFDYLAFRSAKRHKLEVQLTKFRKSWAILPLYFNLILVHL